MKGLIRKLGLLIGGLIIIPITGICQSSTLAKIRQCANSKVIEDARQVLKKNPYSETGVRAGLENKVYTSPDSPLLVIPVVVHIIHNDSDAVIGQGTNLPDQTIFDQIEILNQDYRKKLGTRGFNTHPDGVDTRIEYRLAQRDPQGNPTTGIVRVNSGRNNLQPWNIFNENYQMKARSFWPSNHYLNIWVVNLEQYLGGGQFPISNLIGVPTGVPTDSLTDGVVISYQYFGLSGSLGAPYNLGRTLTHELGHYLGLLHIWADVNDCINGTDYCADTPEQDGFFYGCPTGRNSCPNQRLGPDMVPNYLNYTDDRCMNIFTRCQSQRMRYVLRTSIRRKTLLNSPALLPLGDPIDRSLDQLVLYPNPSSSGVFTLKFPQDTESKEVITRVWDATGKKVLERTGFVSVPEYTVDLSHYPGGLYSLEVFANQRSRRFRMVKTSK